MLLQPLVNKSGDELWGLLRWAVADARKRDEL
jgi:hypothetical protein